MSDALDSRTRENQARRAAAGQGLALYKQDTGYMLASGADGVVLGASPEYSATLEDVEHHLGMSA